MKTAKQKIFAVLALLLAMTMIFCACGQKKDAKTAETEESETAKTPADTDVPESDDDDDDDDDVDEVELDGDFILDMKNADVSAMTDIMFDSMESGEIADLIKDNVDPAAAEKGWKKFFKTLTFSFDADEGTMIISIEEDDAVDAMVGLIADMLKSIPEEAFAKQAGMSAEELEAKLEEMGVAWDDYIDQVIDGMKEELAESIAESFESIDDNSTEFTLEGDKLTIGEGNGEITLTLKAVKGGYEIRKCKTSAGAEVAKVLFPEGTVLKQK